MSGPFRLSLLGCARPGARVRLLQCCPPGAHRQAAGSVPGLRGFTPRAVWDSVSSARLASRAAQLLKALTLALWAWHICARESRPRPTSLCERACKQNPSTGTSRARAGILSCHARASHAPHGIALVPASALESPRCARFRASGSGVWLFVLRSIIKACGRLHTAGKRACCRAGGREAAGIAATGVGMMLSGIASGSLWARVVSEAVAQACVRESELEAEASLLAAVKDASPRQGVDWLAGPAEPDGLKPWVTARGSVALLPADGALRWRAVLAAAARGEPLKVRRLLEAVPWQQRTAIVNASADGASGETMLHILAKRGVSGPSVAAAVASPSPSSAAALARRGRIMVSATMRDGDFGPDAVGTDPPRPLPCDPWLRRTARGYWQRRQLRLLAGAVSERVAVAMDRRGGAARGEERQQDEAFAALGRLAGCPDTPAGVGECVRILVSTGRANADLCDCNGHSPLHAAVMHGNMAVASALVDAGADPDGRSMTASPAPLRSARRTARSRFALETVFDRLQQLAAARARSRAHLHAACRGVPGFGPQALPRRPLELALLQGDAAMAHMLARHGASICPECVRTATGGSVTLSPARLEAACSEAPVTGMRPERGARFWSSQFVHEERKRAEDAAREVERGPGATRAWRFPESAVASSTRHVGQVAQRAEHVVLGLAVLRGARRHEAWEQRAALVLWRQAAKR